MPYKNPEDRRAHAKAYRIKNAEIIKQKRKKYLETHKEIKKKWNQSNKEKINQQQRDRWSRLTQEQKQLRTEKKKLWFKNTTEEYKENIKLKAKEYRKKHKDKINQWHRDWVAKNPDKIRANRLKYEKNRRKDPLYRIKKNLRSRISEVLAGKSKSSTTMKLLGCSLEEFKIYMESKFSIGMSWENYGFYGWHCDHIIPCDAFDLSLYEEQRKCFHYTNLQPLWWKDNIKKSHSLIK